MRLLRFITVGHFLQNLHSLSYLRWHDKLILRTLVLLFYCKWLFYWKSLPTLDYYVLSGAKVTVEMFWFRQSVCLDRPQIPTIAHILAHPINPPYEPKSGFKNKCPAGFGLGIFGGSEFKTRPVYNSAPQTL